MAATFAFLHHLAAFTLVTALAIQFVLLRDEVTLGSARKLQAVDAASAASSTSRRVPPTTSTPGRSSPNYRCSCWWG
jgi:uncharacterized membrane protein